jgi:hypothetical protein
MPGASVSGATPGTTMPGAGATGPAVTVGASGDVTGAASGGVASGSATNVTASSVPTGSPAGAAASLDPTYAAQGEVASAAQVRPLPTNDAGASSQVGTIGGGAEGSVGSSTAPVTGVSPSAYGEAVVADRAGVGTASVGAQPYVVGDVSGDAIARSGHAQDLETAEQIRAAAGDPTAHVEAVASSAGDNAVAEHTPEQIIEARNAANDPAAVARNRVSVDEQASITVGGSNASSGGAPPRGPGSPPDPAGPGTSVGPSEPPPSVTPSAPVGPRGPSAGPKKS